MSQHLLSRLTPYADRIYGGQPVDFGLVELLLVGFFCICNLLAKKLENSGAEHYIVKE